MKKVLYNKKKFYNRCVGCALALVMSLTVFPLNIIPELIPEKAEKTVSNFALEAQAATDPDELAALVAWYNGSENGGYSGSTSPSFTSSDALSKYSKCFDDTTFAATHADDTITLATTGGPFVFDTEYNPIGTAASPFSGTLKFTTIDNEYDVETYSPIFDYVMDSVTLIRLQDSVSIPININRIGDVGTEVSPLFAMHVKGSGTGPYNWNLKLDSASACSYSGVIYEMYNGAKINLTFTDNSTYHTPIKDNNDNIVSGSIIANNESSTNYGILCGKIVGSSQLTATYTNTADTAITFIGTDSAYCGGLIGEINASTFELLTGSSSAKVDFKTAKNEVGFICGHAESGTITLPTGYTFQGTVDGKVYAGGIAGYCKNTTVNYATTTGNITLDSCNVNGGTTTGGVFGYYECDTAANDILLTRSYNLTSCTVAGTGISGGIAGEYKPNYSGAVTIDLDKYTIGNTTTLNTGTGAGGLFGKYTAPGNVTITDSDTDTDFTPPNSSVPYGGVIGEYVNSAYANTLTLGGFTVTGLSCTSSGNVGGIIRELNGSTYVDVSGVSITNASVSNATVFGGIVATLDSSNAGSFIDLTGNYTLSLASGTYKGGAIAGSFKAGVIRLAGLTDISGAQAANGYAQLVYENDETLVYSLGNGSDYVAAVGEVRDSETNAVITEATPASGWTLKRNAATTASDLGQWGEVVRMFTVSGTEKNAEEAGIVSFANKQVTVAYVTANPAITDEVSFAKVALNIQLNDGSDHGPLCFQDENDVTEADKTDLLASDITVNGKIELSGTGLLGLMRDGGNNTYLDTSNTFQNVSFFTGSISKANGAETAEIELAVGEVYGCDANGTALASTATGGKIYLSNNNGHDAQGLIAFAKGAAVTNLKVSGTITVENVERTGGSDYLYAGALFGAMTNGAALSGVNFTTTLNITRATDANSKFYIGGVSGVFDGTDTSNENGYTLEINTSSSIKPTINLYGSIACDSDYTKNNSYVGGVLGLLKGSSADSTQTKYSVSITNSEVSPAIIIDANVANTNLSYLGGMIGRVAKNTKNARTITVNTVSMTGARVDTKAKYPGGLLGAMWERTNLTVDELTITGSNVYHKYSDAGSKQSGLVFMGSGKWSINTLGISSSSFSSTNGAPASFGLIVNEAYSGDDGLYINLLNRGYTLTNVAVPTASTDTNYYVDEIAADTSSGDILVGGNGTGIVNINMNAAGGTKTKITDVSESTENGTGTYQNRLYSQLNTTDNNLIGNQNSRYYYNLDVMLAKGTKGSSAPGGEQFLLWSVYNYAASNIRGNFKANGDMITATAIDLSGLSYYPIPGGTITMPENATVTFGYKAIHDYEDTTITPDNWKRFPDNVGDPKSDTARNQHYLMQTGLFTTVSSLSATGLTLTGDFGYIANVASGALINSFTSGSVTLSGITLNKLTPSNAASYLLINSIDGTGSARPSLTVSNLRATNYNATGVTLPVAQSLYGTATGQNMTMNFSDIKLDARDGSTISDTSWTSAAADAMETKYGTSRSIFGTAIFFTELWAAKSSTMEYYYTVDEDWGTGTPRNVTYGKEVTDSREYQNGENKYNVVGNSTRHYTNPISDSNTVFSFSAGFLPYVGNYTDKGKNVTYPVTEILVNYKVEGLSEGCGTYNDPYIISTASQLNLIAGVVNNGDAPASIRLPNTMSVSSSLPFAATWHTGTNGDGLYNVNGSNYVADSSNSSGLTTWTTALVRNYLASAYYVINADLTGENSLPSDFEGIGKPGTSVNGSIVFHGVIVGKKSNGSAPTITNPSGNPLIYISNGSVVKNLKINITGNVTKTQSKVTISGKQENAVGNNAVYGYGRSLTSPARYENAVYYGGVIGEIMGGDNIIDDVTVTYTGNTTLSGNYKHLIAEGGMVGCVVNGALIFRGANTVTGRNVIGGGIYSNQFVGRVINGYAIYEKIASTDTAPDNYNTRTVTGEGEEEQVTKTYTYSIDTIDRNNTNKLDVDYKTGTGTITVPDAQALYIMSLITQSIASTANTDANTQYGANSPSYGYNSYITGVARLGDYTSVGCGTDATQPDDYSKYAYRDSVNNTYSSGDDLLKSPTPYIIYRYTTAHGTDSATSKNYPARKMTFDNTYFWEITLSKSDTFENFDDFQAFRGIGCVGINSKTATDTTAKTAFKVATFDGGGNTIDLHISLPRYGRDQENYFHYQNTSLTQAYSGEKLSEPYGHDGNLGKLMGIGLFDCVTVKKDSNHEYQFKNFKLQGTVEDKVYSTQGVTITGTTNQTQLFCVGGVYGKRVNGNGSDVNFQDITFDGLTISCAYSCGGLVGIDAVKTAQQMKIDNCNSTSNGISVTGGCFANTDLRHGVGCFVGMTFWTRPYIDGDDSTTEKIETANISVSNVTTYNENDKYASVAGGLIGYTGSGAEIKNINLNGLGSNPVIGSDKVLNAGGFIGFSQADSTNTTIGYIVFDNCTLNGISVQAKNSAAGFLARCGNTNDTYYPRAVSITNCAVIGNSQNKPEIRAFGTNTTDNNRYRFGAGGFVADLSLNSNGATITSVIEDCYITDYLIEGSNVGGIIGTETTKPAYFKNIYVKDCDVITTLATDANVGNIGGIVGRSTQNLSGYNLKIDGVNFYRRSGDNLTDVTSSDAGIIIGRNSSSLVDKFVAIEAYHSDASKVPASVVKINGANSSNFFVFADYTNASAADITAKAGYASTFGATAANNAGQPSAPYVNVAPHMSVGTSEYLTGDGASVGKAGVIYQDIKTGTSNRKYAIGNAPVTDSSVGNTPDATTLSKYINDDGTYKDGAFKISTASAEFGENFPEGVDNFAMLVINDDSAKSSDITPFIKSYIRLVTNAAGSSNGLTNNQYAYSCGSSATATNIDALYKVVVRPCYYSSSAEKFVLGTAGAQGLQLYSGTDTNAGKYYFDSTKADSASNNTCQFSLIDVQFIDPTDSTKIAYHLYVPVYTKKMLSADFSAVSMTATPYYRSVYASKIASEIAAGKNASTVNPNPSILVESTGEWTTTFIRYTYPKNQISSTDNWNFNKSIILKIENNFDALPVGTKLILLDPNANADKYYTYTLEQPIAKGTEYTLALSIFKDEKDNMFTPQTLSAILADTNASSGNELYEDYYISMYVPNTGDAHGIRFGSGTEMTRTGGDNKANIEANLYSFVFLGDLFDHNITSFTVAPSNAEITNDNNTLTTNVTAKIQLKDTNASAYLNNSDIQQSFYISLTSHDAESKVSDMIYGTNQSYITNNTTITYNDGTAHTIDVTESYLGPNYVQLKTGSIKRALLSNSFPEITISSTATITFMDINAFPYNPERVATGIGTQVSIKSNIAYSASELLYSSMKKTEEDPIGTFYYVTTRNNAELNFSAVPAEDSADEVGLKTNNRSLLGVNGKYSTLPPIKGKSIYDANDIVDYESASAITYTISLYKKVTDANGTRYELVDNIGRYLTSVSLTDSEVTLTPDTSNPQLYKYTGDISHRNPKDQDKMFEADFSANVITGDTGNREYANYKIYMTVELTGASNTWKDSFIIYTNAKFDPSVIDELS